MGKYIHVQFFDPVNASSFIKFSKGKNEKNSLSGFAISASLIPLFSIVKRIYSVFFCVYSSLDSHFLELASISIEIRITQSDGNKDQPEHNGYMGSKFPT